MFCIVNYREELKTIFKSCLVHLQTVADEHSVNNSEIAILAEFLDIILKGKLCVPLQVSDKKQLCMDSYEKELLSVAIMADNRKTKTLVANGHEVSNIS